MVSPFVIPEGVLGPIPMMDIPVHNQDAKGMEIKLREWA